MGLSRTAGRKENMKRILIIALLSAGLMCQTVHAQDFMYCDDIYSMAEEICKPYNLSPELVQAIIWTESRYDVDAKNGSCIGLAQINKSCHEDRMERLGVTDLTNPYDNILVCADYLAELYREYEDTGLVLDKYRGSSSAESNFKKGIVSSYTKTVTEKALEFEIEHGKGDIWK